MKSYKPRLIDALIERKLRSAGAVVLRRPRAVGKTTSALHHAASSFRLDQRKDLIDAAELASATLLAGPVPRLVDEWQLAPNTRGTTVAGMGGADIPAYASLIVKAGWPAWYGLDIAVAMDALRDYVDNIADVSGRWRKDSPVNGTSAPVFQLMIAS